MNDRGKALLTWIDDGVNASYFDGEAWSEGVRVASHDTSGSENSVLTSDLGVITWNRAREGANPDVYTSLLQNGLWSTPKLLGEGSTFEPKASAEGTHAVVAWNTGTGENDQTYTTYAASWHENAWAPASNLSATPVAPMTQPRVTHKAAVSVTTWLEAEQLFCTCSAGTESWAAAKPIAVPGESTLSILSMDLSPDASQGLVFLVGEKLWMSRYE